MHLKRSELIEPEIELRQVLEVGQEGDVGESSVAEGENFNGGGVASVVVLEDLVGGQRSHWSWCQRERRLLQNPSSKERRFQFSQAFAPC